MTATHPQYTYPIEVIWKHPKRLYALVTLVLLCLAPNCNHHGHARTAESECVDNLKSLFTAVRAFYPPREQRQQLTLFTAGFSPERGNRYAYFLGAGPMEDRSGLEPVRVDGEMGIGVDLFKFKDARPVTLQDLPSALAEQVGILGTCPGCDFIAACAGDIDNNPYDSLDVWSVSSKDRVIDGVSVIAGEPYHHVNDRTSN